MARGRNSRAVYFVWLAFRIRLFVFGFRLLASGFWLLNDCTTGGTEVFKFRLHFFLIVLNPWVAS